MTQTGLKHSMKQSSRFLLQLNKYSSGTTDIFDVMALNSETGTLWFTVRWSCRNSAFWKFAQWLMYSWSAILSHFSLPRELWIHQKGTFFPVKICGFHHFYCLACFSDFCIIWVLRTLARWVKGWPGLPGTQNASNSCGRVSASGHTSGWLHLFAFLYSQG